MELFIRMYEPHEAREDTVLFPAMRSIVSRHEFDALGEDFERKEHHCLGRKDSRRSSTRWLASSAGWASTISRSSRRADACLDRRTMPILRRGAAARSHRAGCCAEAIVGRDNDVLQIRGIAVLRNTCRIAKILRRFPSGSRDRALPVIPSTVVASPIR